MAGHWCKGLTKETDERVRKRSLKISEALKGKPQPWNAGENNPSKKPGVGAKISKAKKGVPVPLERRKRISETLKGRKRLQKTSDNQRKTCEEKGMWRSQSEILEERKKKAEYVKKHSKSCELCDGFNVFNFKTHLKKVHSISVRDYFHLFDLQPLCSY